MEATKSHRWNFRSLIAWRLNGGYYWDQIFQHSISDDATANCSMMWLLCDLFIQFQHLWSSDENIMKKLSHFFVRLSLTPIIESFLSSDFRYSNNKKNCSHPGTSWCCSNWTALLWYKNRQHWSSYQARLLISPPQIGVVRRNKSWENS